MSGGAVGSACGGRRGGVLLADAETEEDLVEGMFAAGETGAGSEEDGVAGATESGVGAVGGDPMGSAGAGE